MGLVVPLGQCLLAAATTIVTATREHALSTTRMTSNGSCHQTQSDAHNAAAIVTATATATWEGHGDVLSKNNRSNSSNSSVATCLPQHCWQRPPIVATVGCRATLTLTRPRPAFAAQCTAQMHRRHSADPTAPRTWLVVSAAVPRGPVVVVVVVVVMTAAAMMLIRMMMMMMLLLIMTVGKVAGKAGTTLHVPGAIMCHVSSQPPCHRSLR